MERFQKIKNNITRCTYSPGTDIENTSDFVAPAMMEGETVHFCPLPILDVSFEKRDIYRYAPVGEPKIEVQTTVDGQRAFISNLEQQFDRTAYRAVITLDFSPEEMIFGLGQDEDGLWNKRGTVQYLYQHNMQIPMPMFISSKGYGVLFNCGCTMVFDDRREHCTITLDCVSQADFFVITGTLDEIVAGYRALTGTAAPMPGWVWGYWQSKEKYSSQQELLDVASRYRELGIPLDVLVQDWKTWEGDLWGDKHLDKTRFPNMKEASGKLHDMHVHTLISVWPNMNTGGRDHQEMAEHGFLLNDCSTYNALNEDARKLYWQQAERELYNGGFDGWWCDSTEPFTPDWGGEFRLPAEERYHLVGGTHEKYLDPAKANEFALYHARGIFENQPEGPVVNLTRAGWAGIQKFGAILWAGDTAATWQELRREIAKGMSISLCGIPYWTVDAGAFFVGGPDCWRKWCGNPDADPVWFWHGDYDKGVEDLGYQELYTRWLQFACFLPIFRSHGTDTPREIWNFDEPFRSAIEQTIRLRYRLMPYIQNMARRVTEEHYTMLRTMAFDFPNDPRAWETEDQFLFGSDILVCPVTEAILYDKESTPVEDPAKTKVCYLPAGTRWVDFWTGEIYEGGRDVEVPLFLSRIPLFVREGVELNPTEGLQYVPLP